MLRASLVQIQREQRGEDRRRDGIKLKLGGKKRSAKLREEKEAEERAVLFPAGHHSAM